MDKRRQSFVSGALALLLAVFSLPGAGSAEPPAANRGRLPDGRPFRIDPASGLRLSDYVAELEVSSDDLRRQIVALEDEINDQRQQIAQYEKQTGVKLTPRIKESTLLHKSALPPAKSAPISCAPGDPQITAMAARIKELENQVKAAGSGHVVPAACDYNSPANPLQQQVVQSREEIAKLQQQLAATTQVALDREQQIARLEQQSANRAPRGEDSSVSSEQRARQFTVDSSSITNSGDRAELVASLNRLQSLVLERKNLLDAVKKTKKGVAVSIQPLTTKGRVTLDDMRVNVQRYQNGQESEGLRASLAELEHILNDDIAVFRRLSQ